MELEEVMHPPKVEVLRAWYWRSEILQVMFWLKDEGFGDQVDASLLERFLGVDSYVSVQYLDRLLEEGYVERIGDRYALSEAGARKGGREFAASFEELMKPTHGECSPDCRFGSSPDHWRPTPSRLLGGTRSAPTCGRGHRDRRPGQGVRVGSRPSTASTSWWNGAPCSASKVAVIDAGRLLAVGRPEELKAEVGGTFVVVTVAERSEVAARPERSPRWDPPCRGSTPPPGGWPCR